MPEQPITPDDDFLAWRRSVDRQLDAEHRAPQLLPDLAYPLSPYGGAAPPTGQWYIAVTHGSFDASQASRPWLGRMTRCVHQSLYVRVPWGTDLGTTGQIRLEGEAGFPAFPTPTSAISLPAGSTGIAVFNWLHGVTPWEADDFAVFVAARRTAGAGNVAVGYPYGGVIQRDPRGATPTGV